MSIMTEVEEEQRVEQHYKPYFHPFHGHGHHPHVPTPVPGGEAYHRLQVQKQHVLFELKLWVMVVLGVGVILGCVVYIVLQCRSRLRPAAPQPRGLREDEKELFGSTETLENLIPADNTIRLTVRKEKEFFV